MSNGPCQHCSVCDGTITSLCFPVLCFVKPRGMFICPFLPLPSPWPQLIKLPIISMHTALSLCLWLTYIHMYLVPGVVLGQTERALQFSTLESYATQGTDWWGPKPKWGTIMHSFTTVDCSCRGGVAGGGSTSSWILALAIAGGRS